jgi:hypothetical protein
MCGTLRTWIAAQPLNVKSQENTQNDWVLSL